MPKTDQAPPGRQTDDERFAAVNRAVKKRRRAAAVQDAGAFANDDRTARSVLDCASPLALWNSAGKSGAGISPWLFSAAPPALGLAGFEVRANVMKMFEQGSRTMSSQRDSE